MGGHSPARRIGAAAIWSLLLSATLAGAEPTKQPGFFPPQSTLVLVVGVPGDVESEESYRDQLQGWLELATSSGQVAKVFVLCDDPQAVTLPGSPGWVSRTQEKQSTTNSQSSVASREQGTSRRRCDASFSTGY